jgi:hypothetical protein
MRDGRPPNAQAQTNAGLVKPACIVGLCDRRKEVIFVPTKRRRTFAAISVAGIVDKNLDNATTKSK